MRGLGHTAAAALIASMLAAGATSALAQGEARAGPPPLPVLLQLRPDQRPAWNAYRNELAQERADAEHARHDVDMLNAMTTPQRLDWIEAQAPRRDAALRRHDQAVRAFYAALSPDQRRTYDDVTRAQAPPAPTARPSLALPPSATADAPRPPG